MFWIFLVIGIFGLVTVVIGATKSDPENVLVGVLALVAAVLAILAMNDGVKNYACEVHLINDVEEQVMAYDAGLFDTYDELRTFQETIDNYNEGFRKSQNTFLRWPFVPVQWKERKEFEYPEDLRAKEIEALKREGKNVQKKNVQE